MNGKRLNILFAILLSTMLFCNGYSQTLTPLQAITYSGFRGQSNVTATIVVSLTASHTSLLEFGNFNPEDSEESKIIISPEGERKISGVVRLIEDDFGPARYSVSGENAVACKIILPESPTILTNSENSKTLRVSDWHTNIADNQGVENYDGVLKEISLGATLYVGSKEDNPAGLYDGSYAITFMYN